MCKLGQDDLEDHARRVVTISSDNFYKVLNPEERERAKNAEFNFDHPGMSLSNSGTYAYLLNSEY